MVKSRIELSQTIKMLVIIKKRILFVNILVFVVWDVAESKRSQNSPDHFIITHLGLVPYDPVKEEDMFEDKVGGFYKAEIFSVPVNDTGNHTAQFIDAPADQNAIKHAYQPVRSRPGDSATVPISFSFKVDKNTEKTPRFSRRADYKFKTRRLAKEDGEQISTGPIRITSGPNEEVKVNGYLKGEVITGLNRPTKLKVEDPPPGWKPLIKSNGLSFETKSKLKYNQDIKDLDATVNVKKRLGPQTGVLNQISGNLDSAMRYYPVRRNPYYKVYGYPSIVELPPERSYYLPRDPTRSYGPGFYSNYYPGEKLNQNYYFNGFKNQTGLVPQERFPNRFEMGTSGFRTPHSGLSSDLSAVGPSPRFGYASYYPTDFESDDFYSRIQSPAFDSKLDFPNAKFMDFKTDGFSGRNLPANLPQGFPIGAALGVDGDGGMVGGVGGGPVETEMTNNNQDKNVYNVRRTVDTQENFGTKTDFFK